MLHPARQGVRRHGAERLGQVVARVRRRLRRGAAPLHGDAHALRAAVPPHAAAARRRLGDRRPPSIALEQRTSRGGANSTVATVTEVAHYLRLLYAKVGELHCPKCDAVVAPMSADALFERLTRRETRHRDRLRAGRAGAQGDVPRPLHRPRRAPACRPRASTAPLVVHRSAAEAREDEGAHHRPHRSLRQARDARPGDVRSRARMGRRRASRRRRSPEREGRAGASECSRRRAPARSAAPAYPSSTRGGSRSTPSRAAATSCEGTGVEGGPEALERRGTA